MPRIRLGGGRGKGRKPILAPYRGLNHAPFIKHPGIEERAQGKGGNRDFRKAFAPFYASREPLRKRLRRARAQAELSFCLN